MFRALMYGVAASLLAGCGAAKESPEPAVPEAPATLTAGEQCVAAADSGRELPADAVARVTVSHIVVKHVDSKRAPDDVTRTRAEACLRATEALKALKQGRDFAELAGEYSDEKGAASRGGSIGAIEPGGVDPVFAAAAFSLDMNQVSNVVETPFGFHIILRTD